MDGKNKLINDIKVCPDMYYGQGWRQEFSYGGLTLPTRGLKYGFQGTINAKNLRKKLLFTFRWGASMLRRGL